MKQVLTQSDDEGGPKKYDHGDYDEDAYEEDETGGDYGERYDSDSYANEDGDGDDDEDHHLGKEHYANESDDEVNEDKGGGAGTKGDRYKAKPRVSYGGDDDSESNLPPEPTGYDKESTHDPPPAIC
jgi:hypothetical protein